MNYAAIKYSDISNGPGIRTSLYVSGCTHHCKNCFNPETWDFGYGKPFTEEVENKIIESCRPSYVQGITLLGGEPMEPANQRALVNFVRRFKEIYPDKTIWCFSGYLLEQLSGDQEYRCKCEVTDEFLSFIDVLVDGEFIQELHDISLRFRGSSNQRLIDIPKTLKAGKIVLWTDDPEFSSHNMMS